MGHQQLLALGAGRRQIDRWLAAGWLTSVHEGVYAVGHRALTPHGVRQAALLAAGPEAALSHRSAAVHRDLLRWDLEVVDVIVPRGGERSRAGIRFHRPRVLGAEDVAIVDGMACTTVARTLVDLAGAVRPAALQRAVERAEYLQVLDVGEVAEVLTRISRPRGARALRRLLTPAGLAGALAESGLERRYLALVQDAGIAAPQLQAAFELTAGERIRADFYWASARLIVEVDGPHHALPLQAAKDRRRDEILGRRGFTTRRFTEDDLRDRPHHVLAVTRALLGPVEGRLNHAYGG